MRYTDLVFDLYGTLVDIRTEEDAQVWNNTAIYYGFYGAHYTGEELKNAFQSAMQSRHAEAGQSYECFPDLPCEITFAQLFREKDVTEEAQQLGFQAAQLFRVLSIRYLRVYEGVVEALENLRHRGYRLWLLSNAQRVFTAYELRYLGLDRLFDGIYISSDYGCRKPDRRFFHALIEERHLDVSKCLMIGNDRLTDIAGAKAVGMDTLYLHANITPPDQPSADPALLPSVALAGCHHFEFEGNDWSKIVTYIMS